ncbi:MAG: SDR family oxidoreductase [Ignavibacteriales bacterium]|nr:SDR family oxidoreductase [Ignavibacteriales bacterium]
MKNKNCLVTGGAGFIGSHIAEKLVELGNKVRVLDNLSTGKIENINSFIKEIEFTEGDIRDYATVQNALKNVDVVFHLAALSNVARSVEEPLLTNEINVNGTLNILNSMKEEGIKRMVFSSSAAVYGDSPELPKREDMLPNPLSPYAVSKLTGEYYCKVFSDLYNMEIISLRYFNVFGPRQDPNSEYAAVIPKFINLMLNDKQPVIYGDGEQTRDFIFIDDVVECNLLAANGVEGNLNIFNCASGLHTSLNELVVTLNKILGKNIEPIYAEAQKGDIKHSGADIKNIKQKLNYKPNVEFDNALVKSINYFNS